MEIDRLILMGNDWQVKLFENYLNRHIRELIIGYAPRPSNIENPSTKEILERVTPILREAEEREEMQLIEDAKSPIGVSGLQKCFGCTSDGSSSSFNFTVGFAC